MNKNILVKEVQHYINENLNTDVGRIALTKSPFNEISAAELANQVLAKKKSEKKLPTWFNANDIYFPSSLSIEQTSSEVTALYKSKLITGNSLIDITGGFGVDAYYFAKAINEVTHCEINPELSEIATYNAQILNCKNIDFKAVDGLTFLKNTKHFYDNIYVDPARRAQKGKVFMLKDCTPDVVSNLDLLLEKCNRIIIKTAPLLDITAGLAELKNVAEIHIISVKNECKELLWIIEKAFKGETKIIAVTLNQNDKNFSFGKTEANIATPFTNKLKINEYLYEPDVALLKSGAFNLIAVRYNLVKLHPQTQLYTSPIFNDSFPGRIFKIEEVLTARDLKNIKNLSGNVIVRNYPAKPEDLIKKHKIKAEKELFLIFTKTVHEESIIVKARILQYY